MKKLLCALMLVLFVGGALGCEPAEKEEKEGDPEPKKEAPETP